MFICITSVDSKLEKKFTMMRKISNRESAKSGQ